MAKITIWGNDGKPLTHLTQWDNNRDVTVKGLKVFDQPPEFHFWDRDRFRAIVVPSEIVDGGVKAHVPNILMQSDDDVIFTVYDRTLGNEGRSVYIRNIPVLRAKKPEDYDYTDNIDYINFTQLIKEAEALLEMLRTAGDEALANSRAALEAATKALEQAASASQSASDAEALAKQFADQLAGFLVADDSQTTDKNLWTAKKIREEIDKGSPDGVTQKYVDQQDKETLEAAKKYTDDHSSNGTVKSVNGTTPDPAGNVKIDIPKNLSDLSADNEHRTVTDAQIEKWDSSTGGGVSQTYVDQQDAEVLKYAKDYSDSKLVTIEIEDRGGQNFWTRPVTTANEIIDMVNAGKEVRLSFYDAITNTGDQLYPYENTRQGVCYFRRNVITANAVSRISWGVQYNGSIVATEIPYTPPLMTAYAVCHDPAAPPSSTANTWYIPKSMPKPSGNVGMMVDVHWENGLVNGLGYNASLIWGEPGGADNETIVSGASITDTLTGEHSIPTEGTVRYQLEETSGRMHWRYVSGDLIPTEFSTATDAATADKLVPGLALGYLPGMEIYVQMDAGNTADLMRLVPDEGATLPVYGNGVGAHTGDIPAGYILHLKNAGDHWQIINAPGGEGGSAPDIFWCTMDSSFDDIKAAYDKKMLPILLYGKTLCTIHVMRPTEALFVTPAIPEARIVTFTQGVSKPSVDKYLMVAASPQTMTKEQQEQARKNIGVTEGGAALKPLTFTGASTEKYDGTKPVTVDIPAGGPGGDIGLGVTGASIGQIIEVEEVNEEGKPTKWKAVVKPGGGGGGPVDAYDVDAIVPSALDNGTVDPNVQSILDALADQPATVKVIPSSSTNAAILPNIYYKWGEMASLKFVLDTGMAVDGVVNEYAGEFVSGQTPTVFTPPADIVWTAPIDIKPNTAYQFSIVNGIGRLWFKGSDASGGGALQKLTFTGASTAEYDGTAPVTVNIPTVQDVLDALPKWTGGAF